MPRFLTLKDPAGVEYRINVDWIVHFAAAQAEGQTLVSLSDDSFLKSLTVQMSPSDLQVAIMQDTWGPIGA